MPVATFKLAIGSLTDLPEQVSMSISRFFGGGKSDLGEQETDGEQKPHGYPVRMAALSRPVQHIIVTKLERVHVQPIYLGAVKCLTSLIQTSCCN